MRVLWLPRYNRENTHYPKIDGSTMQTLKGLPRVAYVVAFVIAGFVVLAGLMGPVVVLPIAIFPLCAGVGILRKRVWSAYGFATYSFAQLLLLPVILLRPGYSTGRVPQIVVMALFSLGLGILFLLAGRSMAASGAARGRAWPWIAATALITVPFFFGHTFEVASGSMENTLLPGDRILAQTFPLPTPTRGQLAVFLSPADHSLILIKRVIAVPGDHIRIAKKVVILNGTALDEKYVTHDARGEEFYPGDFSDEVGIPGCEKGREMLSRQVVNGEIVVPAGNYFVLGDKRENSLDSRCWGFVDARDVIGRPLMIYDSIDRTEEQVWDSKGNWLGHRRWARLFKVF